MRLGIATGGLITMSGRGTVTNQCVAEMCLWPTATNDPNASLATAAAVHVHSNSTKICFFFLVFGSRDPKHGFFGILPELIGL